MENCKNVGDVYRSFREKNNQVKINLNERGITLIALVITTIFSYDEMIKSSNNKGFLLQTI